MDLFQGLKSRQVGALRHVRQYLHLAEGDVLFSEGDPAAHLFAIISGSIEIYRNTLDGDTHVARMNSGEVFGEMGILAGNLGMYRSAGTRTASARATEQTTLMSFSGNPLEMFRELGDHESALAILKNLVTLLAKRLRLKDAPDWIPLSERSAPTMWTITAAQGPIEVVRANLPMGLFRRMRGRRTLKEGEFLCRQDDKADGFFFIHEGKLEVSQSGADGAAREIARLSGPAIAGEVAFFSGEPHSASAVALTDLRYDLFSAAEFRKLESENPSAAFETLFALAQLTVLRILQRENG